MPAAAQLSDLNKREERVHWDEQRERCMIEMKGAELPRTLTLLSDCATARRGLRRPDDVVLDDSSLSLDS